MLGEEAIVRQFYVLRPTRKGYRNVIICYFCRSSRWRSLEQRSLEQTWEAQFHFACFVNIYIVKNDEE
jgi:hypothetical protein